jgi:hypothetical protein
MNLQRNVFQKGKSYRVKRNFISGPSSFVAGEIIIYDAGGYSPYDNCFIDEFLNSKDDERKMWLNAPDDPDLWQEYLELVN